MQIEKHRTIQIQGYFYTHLNAIVHISIHPNWFVFHHGADVNAQEGLYKNALQATLSKGHMGVVQLLLDSRADVNAEEGLYGNVL